MVTSWEYDGWNVDCLCAEPRTSYFLPATVGVVPGQLSPSGGQSACVPWWPVADRMGGDQIWGRETSLKVAPLVTRDDRQKLLF